MTSCGAAAAVLQSNAAMMSVGRYLIPACSYDFVIGVSRAKETECGRREVLEASRNSGGAVRVNRTGTRFQNDQRKRIQKRYRYPERFGYVMVKTADQNAELQGQQERSERERQEKEKKAEADLKQSLEQFQTAEQMGAQAGWSLGYVSAVYREGRTIWIVDAHRRRKRFVMRAEEKLMLNSNL